MEEEKPEGTGAGNGERERASEQAAIHCFTTQMTTIARSGPARGQKPGIPSWAGWQVPGALEPCSAAQLGTLTGS